MDLRSKTRTLEGPFRSVEDLPAWNYDGSSTNQAPGQDSEVILVPRKVYRDPFRATAMDKDHILDHDRKNSSVHNRALYVEHRSLDKPALSPVAEPERSSATRPEILDGCRNLLVMCDTYDSSGRPIPTNTRAAANAIFTLPEVSCEEPWFGIEQEYTLLDSTTRWPLGWPKGGYPGPQGPYYCGIGADRMFGRNIADAHYRACHYAGLSVSGINAEVMPGQWEFQVGPCVGIDAGDQLWMARYILQRVCELTGDVVVTYDPKPVPGDWNGAGAHCNYSTRSMREKRLGGMNEIERAIRLLEDRHAVHIAAYGPGNERRLTGKHETAAMDKFTWGVADRGASIRVGNETASTGAGYIWRTAGPAPTATRTPSLPSSRRPPWQDRGAASKAAAVSMRATSSAVSPRLSSRPSCQTRRLHLRTTIPPPRRLTRASSPSPAKRVPATCTSSGCRSHRKRRRRPRRCRNI